MQVRTYENPAPDETSMAVIEAVADRSQGSPLRKAGGVTMALHRPEHAALIGFESDEVIRAPLADLFGDGPLTAHGIQCHDAPFEG